MTFELEKILDKLASKKSRQKFIETAIENQMFDYKAVPEKYTDDVLDMELSDSKGIVTGATLDKNQQLKTKVRCMADLAEHVGRYELAARFYDKLGLVKKAVDCAMKAGLDNLAQEWADEYIQAAELEAPKNTCTDKIDNRAIEAARRAKELGLKERADKIVRNYVEQFSHLEEDPEGHEARANFAKQYATRELAERFYVKAMLQFEEAGEYASALRIARELKDSEKTKFYDNLRFLVADEKRREEIEQDRADDADGREFEFGTQE